tara:strand:- start:299 stop:1027 length:729 start_codon:yes stop_codon:yes gene_type:complete
MINHQFSYKAYSKILKKYKDKFCDFANIEGINSYVLLRHDVEFSPKRALEIAKIENYENISSSYLFQVRSNAYNVLSTINRKIINEILCLGHNVGLHFYVSNLEENNWYVLRKELIKQTEILNFAINKKIDRFSYHRPPRWVLEKRDDYIEGLINMYGKSFFELSDSPKNIKYLADSKHCFPYGNPIDNYDFKKIQILLHPDEWSNDGYQAKENFKLLADEHLDQLKLTFKTETKIYSKLFL